MYAAAEGQPNMFLHLPSPSASDDDTKMPVEGATPPPAFDLEAALAPVRERAIREWASFGVAVVHEGLSPAESAALRGLYDQGICQVRTWRSKDPFTHLTFNTLSTKRE